MKNIRRVFSGFLAALLLVVAVPFASADDSNMENPDPIVRPSLPNVNITTPPVGSYIPESLMQWDLKSYYNKFEDFSIDFTSGKIPPLRDYTVSQFKQSLELSPPNGFNYCYYYTSVDSLGTPSLSMVYSTVPLKLVPYPDFMKTNPNFVYPKYALMARAKDSFTYDNFSKTPYLFNVLSVSISLSTGKMGAGFSHTVFGSGSSEESFYSDDKCLFLASIPENFTYCYPNITIPFINETGNPTLGTPSGYVPPLGPGEFDGTYRAQTYLESYSNYDEKNYPGAPYLKKSSDWILTPLEAFNDDRVNKGNKDNFRGFYFLPVVNSIPTGTRPADGQVIDYLFRDRYTYHLYLFDGEGWARKSVWCEKPLKFTPAREEDGRLVAPQLKIPDNTPAVILNYGGGDGSFGSLTSLNGPYSPMQGGHVISAQNIYLVNDDIAAKKDTDNANKGSSVDTGGTIVDGNGNSPGGGSWDKPQMPGEGADVLDWISYIFESIGSFFSGLVEMVQNAISDCGSFFEFLGGVFSFVPAPIWGVITLGLGLVVFLRIFAR